MKINKKAEYKDKVVLVLGGDMNDGDYTYETSVFNIDELKNILPIVKLIYEDIVSTSGEDMSIENFKILKNNNLLDLYKDIAPQGQYGCHSIWIESFKFYDEDGNDYNIELKYLNNL